MLTQIYTFTITYSDCDNKIWRTAAVSSNYTLAELGYMVLATFDTMAHHLFDMRYNDTTYLLAEEDLEDLPFEEDEKYDLLSLNKIGKLGINIGDTVKMTYDMGCGQIFDIKLIEIGDMPRGRGRAYPKILDGAGSGIVDDMPACELLEAIRRIDATGHSGIYYSSSGYEDDPEWDYRNYNLDIDNSLLKGSIDIIHEEYENCEE